jgi:CRP-like cAMP-binding protein
MALNVKSIFRKRYTTKEQSLYRFLRSNVLFKNLSSEQLERIVPHLFLRQFKLNEVIFFQKDPSQALYIIKSGRVKLYIDTHHEEEKLIVLERGFMFGQNSIIEGTRRNYNAIVVSEGAEIYALPRVSLIEVMQKDLALKAAIHSELAAYFSEYISKVFSTYKRNFGFFELNQIYDRLIDDID